VSKARDIRSILSTPIGEGVIGGAFKLAGKAIAGTATAAAWAAKKAAQGASAAVDAGRSEDIEKLALKKQESRYRMRASAKRQLAAQEHAKRERDKVAAKIAEKQAKKEARKAAKSGNKTNTPTGAMSDDEFEKS
jgi:hypothetical protein